ncbi:hypothetical protein FRC00_012971 [Tulasnella sp. 408]|nr:hypothetical protein FRC00_012971 [Tulasnella sp. 408]
MSERILPGHAQLNDYDFDFDANGLVPIQSPASLTSSLIALSPVSDFHPIFGSPSHTRPILSRNLETAIPASSSRPANPAPSLDPAHDFAIKLGPCPSRCGACGSTVLTPPPSTVALYYLALTMAPSTRLQSAQTAHQPVANPPPATSKRAKNKRKAPCDEEDPAPAEPPLQTETQPRAKPKPKPKSKKGNAPVPAEPTLSGNGPVSNTLASSSQDAPAGSTQGPNIDTDSNQPARASPSRQGSPGSLAPEEDPAATIESLKKKLRVMTKYKVMWSKQQQDQNALPGEGGSSAPEGSIPRPPGERGKNGWNLQTALQLEADGDKYNLVLAATRDAIKETGLDWRKKFDEQDPIRVGTCYSQMKHVQPYLKKFKADWACRELVISALQNKRKVEHARIKSLMVRSPSKPKSKRAGFKPRSKSASTASPEEEELIDDEDMQEGGGA